MRYFLDIPLIDPGWVEQRLPRLAGLAAVTHKEMRAQQRQMRVWWRMLLRIVFILACFGWLLSTVLAVEGDNVYAYRYGAGSPLSGVILLLALIQVLPPLAGAIARERETGALDMLLLTRLRSHEILGGKLLAITLPIVLVIMISAIAMWVALAVHGTIAMSILIDGFSLCSSVLFIGMLALLCSTWFANSMRAIGLTIGVLAFQWLMPTLASFFGLYGYYQPGTRGLIGSVGIGQALLPAIIFAAGLMVLLRRGVERRTGTRLSLPFLGFLGVLAAAGMLVLYYIVFDLLLNYEFSNWISDDLRWFFFWRSIIMLFVVLLEIRILFSLAQMRLDALRWK